MSDDSVTTELDKEEMSMGERMREAFGGIDFKSAMRLAFGKCPACGARMVRGYWLRWCPDRTCKPGYAGVLNKALGNKIEEIKPQTDAERDIMERLQKRFDDAEPVQ